MKKLTLSILLLASVICNAQKRPEFLAHSQFSVTQFKGFENIETGTTLFADNKVNILQSQGVKEVKKTVHSKKGKLHYTENRTYNSKGRLVSIVRDDHKTLYGYQDDTILTRIEKTSSKGTFLIEQTFEGKLLKSKVYSIDNKKYYSEINTFTDFGKILHNEVTYHRKKKIYERNYTYNDQNKLVYSDFKYNGKLIKSWNYECGEKGEENIPKTTAQKSICKYNEESNDGSYIVYTRRILNNSTTLDKQYYTKDSIMYKAENFVKDSILISRLTIDKNISIFERFDKKSRVEYRYTTKYNDEKMIVEYSVESKKKFHHTSVITYNSNNTIAVIEKKSNKGFYSKVDFSYTY